MMPQARVVHGGKVRLGMLYGSKCKMAYGQDCEYGQDCHFYIIELLIDRKGVAARDMDKECKEYDKSTSGSGNRLCTFISAIVGCGL
jgi:hypothetical protein